MTGHSTHVDLMLFVPSFTGGGAERVMVLLANGFARRGLQVQLVVLSDHGPYRSLVDDRVDLVVLGGRMALAPLKLWLQLRQSRPRVLLSTLNYANVAAAMACKAYRSDIALWFKQANHLSTTLALAHGWKNRLLKALVGWAYHQANGIAAVSRNVADDLAVFDVPAHRVRVIHNPAYDPEHSQAAAEPVTFPSADWDRVPKLVAVGRLVPQKDYPTMIRAFQRVCDNRNARLIILGDGPLRDELSRLAVELGVADRIWFAGFVSNPFAYIKRSDVFVLSSVSEGFGNVLVEAMGLGTPVVSTRCPGGPEEILERGKWGQLVPMADPLALARAVETALDGQGIDARERAQDFSIEAVVDQYLSAIWPQAAGGSVS